MLDALGEIAQRVGLKINKGKTKVMRVGTTQEAPITIEGSPVENVEEFTYSGSKVSQSGGADEDIAARIKKA